MVFWSIAHYTFLSPVLQHKYKPLILCMSVVPLTLTELIAYLILSPWIFECPLLIEHPLDQGCPTSDWPGAVYPTSCSKKRPQVPSCVPHTLGCYPPVLCMVWHPASSSVPCRLLCGIMLYGYSMLPGTLGCTLPICPTSSEARGRKGSPKIPAAATAEAVGAAAGWEPEGYM